MKRIILFLTVGFLFSLNIMALPNPMNSQFSSNDTNHYKSAHFVPGVIIVKFKENSEFLKNDKNKLSLLQNKLEKSIYAVESPFDKLITKSEDKFGVRRIFQMSYSSNISALELSQTLMENPNIEYAEPMYERYIDELTPNDIRYSQQWAPKAIGLEKAWEITTGSPNVLIAVVDNGVFMNHEDLAANIWTNPNEIPDNKLDDDNNGYVDDVNGWDFVGNYVGGSFAPDNNPQPSSGQVSHGTHVAGCAAAVGNNGIGVAGSAWNCKILPIKVGSDNPGVSGIYNGYQGVLYAAKMGADIINCSWGGQGYSQAEQDIINQSVALGAVVIAAAGNDGKDMTYFGQYPAQLDNILSVGSSAQNDSRSYFSNYGYQNCVYAPGSAIQATMPGNGYANQDGTSMASPVLAGVAALVKSLHPNWHHKEIYHQIRSTSDDVLSEGNIEKRLKLYGRVNAYKAVSYNSEFSQNTIPGISLFDYNIDKQKELNKLGTYPAEFTFKNYLHSVELISIKFEPYDKFIKLSQNTFVINNFDSTQNQTVKFDITLEASNPYFDGKVKLLVKYESKNYTDLQIIEIPINIKSTNKSAILGYMPSYLYANWNGSHSPIKNVFWAVGNSQSYNRGLYIASGGALVQNFTQPNEILSSVYSFDFANAFIGCFNNSTKKCELLKTTDAGNTFQRIDVSTITPFVNDIYFFNSKYGIITGDQTSNKFGIAYTSDGGATWKKNPQLPTAQAGENGYTGSFAVFKDNVWFGTNRGRIFASKDKGQAWTDATVETGKHIFKIAFSTANKGIALYGNNQTDDPTKIASTQDGGRTWQKNVFDFSNLNQMPVQLFTADSTEDLFVVTHEGRIYRTSNLGVSWTTILSSLTLPLKKASTYTSGENGRVWFVNEYNIGYTDFNYGEYNPKLVLTTSDNIKFKNTEIGKYDIATVKLQNQGNTIIEFDTIYIENTNDNEFSIALNDAKDLDINAFANLRIKFMPTSKGTKSGNLIINTNAQNFTIPLNGEGIDAGSVEEFEALGLFFEAIAPNPANNLISLKFVSEKQTQLFIDLYNSNGNKIKTINNDFIYLGQNIIQIPVNELPNGAYYLQISAYDKTAILKFIIKR